MIACTIFQSEFVLGVLFDIIVRERNLFCNCLKGGISFVSCVIRACNWKALKTVFEMSSLSMMVVSYNRFVAYACRYRRSLVVVKMRASLLRLRWWTELWLGYMVSNMSSIVWIQPINRQRIGIWNEAKYSYHHYHYISHNFQIHISFCLFLYHYLASDWLTQSINNKLILIFPLFYISLISYYLALDWL